MLIPSLEIPAIKELSQRKQWVLHRQKKPITPRGQAASPTDPSTWSTFAECTQAYVDGIGDGLGFVFTAGDHYTGIDLDGCLDDEGRPSEKAAFRKAPKPTPTR